MGVEGYIALHLMFGFFGHYDVMISFKLWHKFFTNITMFIY